MSLNPSHDLKILLPQLLNTLKQAAEDIDSLEIDLGQAQEVRDQLNNVINAKQQGGKDKDKDKSKSGSSGDDESGEKKSGYQS